MNVTFALAEGYETGPPPELHSQVAQGLQFEGYSTNANLSLDYARIGRRTQWLGSAEAALRHYSNVDGLNQFSHSSALGARVSLPARGTLTVNQTAAYSPSYLFQLFPTIDAPEPGNAIPIAQDYRLDVTDSYTYRSDMTIRFATARGLSMGVNGNYNRTDYQGPSRPPDLQYYTSGATFSQRIARSGTFKVAYEYRNGEFGFGDTSEQRLTIGGEYSMALSVSRRATFRFGLTPSTLYVPETASSAGEMGRLYLLQGEAAVTFPFRRSWEAGTAYRRAVEYLAVFSEPVFADSARVELRGLVGRRVDVLATAAYSDGESALSTGTSLEAYTGTARLRVAWTRRLAFYGEYLYYHYDRHGSLADEGLPTVFDHHGIRLGVMLWTSLF